MSAPNRPHAIRSNLYSGRLDGSSTNRLTYSLTLFGIHVCFPTVDCFTPIGERIHQKENPGSAVS